MLQILALSIPFFALIFLGFGARGVRFCDAEGAGVLTRFAFFITLPPFLFLQIAQSNPADILNWGFVWRYELATIAVFLLAAVIGRGIFTLNRHESGIFGLNAAYPNYGYIGVPLAILAFGREAAIPTALILFADTIVLLTLTAIFVSKGKNTIISVVWGIALTLAKNPLLHAVVLGLAVGALGIALSPVLERFLTLLAGAAAPAALFALGATLYGQPIRGAVGQVGTLSLLKLIIHPLLVAGFFILLPGQSPIWVKVAILSASLPVAANVFVLSHVYGAYSGRTASAILVTTLLASITVPFTLYMLFFYQ